MQIPFFRKRDIEERKVDDKTVDDVLLRAILNQETISRKDALTLPAVSAAVDFVCGTIASMPVKLYEYADGSVREVKGDNRTNLLNLDTGDTLDGYQLKRAMVEDYLLGKGGYTFINWERNKVISLNYVEDEYVTITKNTNPIFKDYDLLVYDETYKPYQFIKLLRNTKNGAYGVGLCDEVSKALETAFNTLKYQLMLVKSGGNKKGFLKSQSRLDKERIAELREAWRRLYANDESNVVVLNNGIEFQEASNSSVEMQLNESKKTLLDEINAIFHIYPNDYERTFKESIYPIIKAFETALNRDLLLEKEKDRYFFRFDVKEIVKANLKERYEAYKIAKEIGLKTINELRQEEDLNAIEGLNVVDFGLASVLYDIDTGTYYTPNTGEVKDVNVDSDGNESETIEL